MCLEGSGMNTMMVLVVIVLEPVLIRYSVGKDLSQISGWLVGINFSLAIFSIHFTFFGYQLSRYKPILGEVSRRQWVNIIILLTIPFTPLVVYLVNPEWFTLVALWLMPIVLYSSIDNAMLTKTYLNPYWFLKKKFSEEAISAYLIRLYTMIAEDVLGHKEMTALKNGVPKPAHEYEYHPNVIGIQGEDLWDRGLVLLKRSLENDDYPVFNQCLLGILTLARKTYMFRSQVSGDYDELNGMHITCHLRMKAMIAWVYGADKGGIFVQSIINELSRILRSCHCTNEPLGKLATNVSEDMVWIASQSISEKREHSHIKILTIIHAVIEHALQKYSREAQGSEDFVLEQHNISFYARLIKLLGQEAVKAQNTHYLYRCMETLSFLGCNAARLKSQQTTKTCLQSLAQLGRESRHAKLGCFWHYCIIPLHEHSEEFMGHILTWLVLDKGKDGSFFLQVPAERAYSRIRGKECKIVPKRDLNPKFWIEEVVDEAGNTHPHVESLSGMYGYGGRVDYSDFNDLTEFSL
jgi:hypothetical protein